MEAKELNLNLTQSIESVYYDEAAIRLVITWQDDHGYWIDYGDISVCLKEVVPFITKIKDLKFIDILD